MTHDERQRIEQALLTLRGVKGAQVCMEDGAISEIHVAAEPGARAKNIARDVRTYLAAALGINVSHQKISVAVCREGIEEQAFPGKNPELAERRIRFNSVNLLVEGLRLQAQVELSFEGRRLIGSATGVPAVRGAERAIAAAALNALQKATRDDVRLWPGDMSFARVGDSDVVLVEVLVVRPRDEQHLIGAALIGLDRQRAVVFAVLDALNRIFKRLSPERWIEFQVEPEASAAQIAQGSAPEEPST